MDVTSAFHTNNIDDNNDKLIIYDSQYQMLS